MEEPSAHPDAEIGNGKVREESSAAYADGKAPEAFRTIGEVASALGIRQHVLRYWEEQFPMLRPVKRSGGRRYYRPEDVRLVETIDRLVHREGYTLRGARQSIEGSTRKRRRPSEAPAGPVGSGLPAAIGEVQAVLALPAEWVSRLQAVRGLLVAALES